MTTTEVIAEIRRVMTLHDGPEEELYEALLSEAEGWEMRLEEIDDVDEDEE